MSSAILLPVIGYSVLSVLVSYIAIRLYRCRGSYSNGLPTPVSSFKLGRTASWDWHKSLLWPRKSNIKKQKPSKHITVELLPTTGLPPPPTALPITPPPPLVDLSSASITRTPSPPVQHINKQIHSLHPTSFPRPPSPHALLATTSPQKFPRRSRSLGGVPVRRLSGGASGLRNVQILDLDMEMQEMNRGTSREHLLIDFSSSGSSDELDASRKENGEEGVISRRLSPASSDIGVLPSHRRPSLFDDVRDPLVTLDLAPGRKVVQLVDLGDVEDGLDVKRKKEEDTWKWFAPPLPVNIHFTPLESTLASLAKPISKSVSEPLPITLLPLPMSEGKLIDFHSGSEQEHVLVDLHVQDDDDNNVPQQEQPEFIHVHRTHVDLNLVVSEPITTAKTAVDVKQVDEPSSVRSPFLMGRRSLDSLLKPIIIVDAITPDPIPVEIQNPISSCVVEASSLRERRVDQLLLEEEMKEVVEKVEAGPTVTTRAAVEIGDEDKDRQEIANEHENHELYDRHDDYSYDVHHQHPQSPDTRGEELQGSSSSPQVTMIPVQAAPVWYWDHEDDPWSGAVGVVNEEDVKEGECGIEEALLREKEEVKECGEEVGEDERGVDLVDVSEMEASLEVGEDEDTVKILPGSEVLELSVERSLAEVAKETEDEESYPDPDYLPLPELLLGLSAPPVVATEVPLILVENGLQDNCQEDEDVDENQNDQDEEVKEMQQRFKDEEKSPRRVAAQMPTPPASPPPMSPLRVKGLGLGGTVGMRSGPPSPSSLSGLLPSASPLPLSTSHSTSPQLTPLLVLTPLRASSPSPVTEDRVKVSEGDKENVAVVDKENELSNISTGRPLWSIRAGDAPALGLAASSLSIPTSTSSAGLIPGVGTNMSVSPRMRRRVLGDVTVVVENGGGEEKEVEIKEEKGEVVKEDQVKEEKDEKDSPLPGAFPEQLKPTSPSDANAIVAPTITVAALTSTLLSTSIAAASSISSTSTPLERSPVIQRRPRQPIARSPLDIALAMQLRPGLGVGADPAWMVRFLMAMFGWFAILVSGQGEF